MTDTERVELIRDIVKSKVSPAAMIEAIKPIVAVQLPAVPELETLHSSKVTATTAKVQDNYVPTAEVRQYERFILLPEICARTGYKPRTIAGYRCKGLSHKLRLPPLFKRGDGRLGCLESELDKYLLEQYRKE